MEPTNLKDSDYRILGRLAVRSTLSNMLLHVVSEAKYFWERAQCPEDFCLQDVCFDGIVFGSTNRVVWSLMHGFKIDESYCTSNFLEANDEYRRK